MLPISKDFSNTFFERSFMYVAPCEWDNLNEHIRTYMFDRVRFYCVRNNNMELTENNNVHIIVRYVVTNVNSGKLILFYSPLNYLADFYTLVSS